MRTTAFLFLWVSTLITFAQRVDDYQSYFDKYEDEDVLVLKDNKVIEITETKEGELLITEEVFMEKILLSENTDEIDFAIIPFNDFSKIVEYKAYGYKPNEKKYSKYRVFYSNDYSSMGGFFYNDYYFKYISYYNIEKGSRTELFYEKEYNEPYLWGSFYLSKGEVVEDGSITVVSPVGMNFNVYSFNTEGIEIKFSEEIKRKKKISRWEYSVSDSRKGELIPGMQYLPSLHILISDYEKDGTKDLYLKDLSTLSKWYHKNFYSAGNEPDSVMNALVDSLVQNTTNEKQKIMTLFDWVRHKVRYIGVEDGYNGYIPRSSNFVFSQRYGDCKDKTNLLIEMLKRAGITAYPAFVGTNDLPFDHEEIVSPIVDNHVIVAVDTNGADYWYLDPTQSEYLGKLPPMAVFGKSALVVTDSIHYYNYHFPGVQPEDSRLVQNVELSISNDLLKQEVDVEANGYFFLKFKNYMFEQNDKRKKDITKIITYGDERDFTVDSVSNFNINDSLDQITYTIHATNQTPVTYSSKGMFVKICPSHFFDIDPYSDLKEYDSYAIDFPAVWEFNFSFNLEEGSHVHSLPADTVFTCDCARFEAKYEEKDGKYLSFYNLRTTEIYIMDDKMEDFTDFFKKIHRYLNQSILITKP
ncbi:MAG: hypothetical protein C0592_08685 [Marinilabiliales bacterium]|nr:MAG: hypothetical protein C0592_08685 [Marinilabiliales bacterium]